jgi:hypothetical protein
VVHLSQCCVGLKSPPPPSQGGSPPYFVPSPSSSFHLLRSPMRCGRTSMPYPRSKGGDSGEWCHWWSLQLMDSLHHHLRRSVVSRTSACAASVYTSRSRWPSAHLLSPTVLDVCVGMAGGYPAGANVCVCVSLQVSASESGCVSVSLLVPLVLRRVVGIQCCHFTSFFTR